MTRKCAELIGTFWLLLGGCGKQRRRGDRSVAVPSVPAPRSRVLAPEPNLEQD
jgi:hypothetical protein